MLARSWIWWPDIEFVSSCFVCQRTQNKVKDWQNITWPSTSYPFEGIHVDLFQFQNTDFFNYGGWFFHMDWRPNIVKNNNYFGFCHALVSDNGPQFRIEEFEVFLRCNGINQMFSPAYHPPSNDLAERGIQTVKRSLKSYFYQTKWKRYLCKIWFSIFYLIIVRPQQPSLVFPKRVSFSL